MNLILTNIADGMIVAVYDTHVKVHKVCINLDLPAFVYLCAERVRHLWRSLCKYDLAGTHQPGLGRGRRHWLRRLLRSGCGAARASILRLCLTDMRDNEQRTGHQQNGSHHNGTAHAIEHL